ncbi:MAG: hypothetical protein G01um101456_291, partial [Parcubacteria group bacterium Gr01-1014_56]
RNNVVSSGSPNTTGWGVVGPLTRALIIQTWKSTSGSSGPSTQPTPGSGGGGSSGSTPTITPLPGGGGGGGSSGGGGGSSVPTPPAPTIQFSTSLTSLIAGQPATLTWVSTNATACTSSGAWSGTKTTSDSLSVSPTANTTYTLTCTGAGGSVSESVSIVVGQPTPNTPTVTITATPNNITTGQSLTITWSSANTQSCLASGGWSGTKALTGTQTVSPTTNTTYTLTCTGAGGSAIQNTTVTVSASPPPPPTSQFAIGNRIQTTSNLNVRSFGSSSGTLLGTQTTGALGTIIAGPTVTNTNFWWQIDYDTGVDGNTHLVLNQCNFLHRIKWLDRNKSNERHAINISNRKHHLHPHLHRHGGKRNTIDNGDG